MSTETKTEVQVGTTGLAGFLCEVSGEPVSFAACYACALGGAPGCPMFPAAIERSLAAQRPADYALQIASRYGKIDYAFSVTEIVYCPRRYRLAQEYPYYERPSALWRMARGTAIHQFLAAGQENAEQTLVWRFSFKGKIIALVGTPDLLLWDGTSYRVIDYKFTDFAPRERKAFLCDGCREEVDANLVCPTCGPLRRDQVAHVTLPPKPHNSHDLQIQLYCLLVAKVLRKPVSGGQVIYLTKKPLKIDVPFDSQATLHFLAERIKTLLSPELPPILQVQQELWQCDYCPLRERCELLHGGPVGKGYVESEA